MRVKIKLLLTLLALPFIIPLPAYADTTYSAGKYQATQTFFGSGGGDVSSTGNYSAQVSLGETGVGNYTAGNYGAYAGFNTTQDPFLQIIVTSASLNLGTLSTSTTATATGTFYVRAWDAQGYVVQTDSPPPQNANSTYYMCTHYTCPTTTTTTTSTAGMEQFGMNVVADTSPSSLTTDSPASASPVEAFSFSHGVAGGASGCTNSDGVVYNSVNNYNYNNGDEVACSASSTGSTIYTLSYIFNISGGTPGGQYIFNQVLVATATY